MLKEQAEKLQKSMKGLQAELSALMQEL